MASSWRWCARVFTNHQCGFHSQGLVIFISFRGPQALNDKEGDWHLRTMMVQGAHYILGPFGEDRICGDGDGSLRSEFVLVQPEMDSGRSPVASIAPFSAGQSATAQYSCG
jgi:hypothetical protein